MLTPTAEHRSPTPPAVWMTARARNAMHRPVFIGAVSVATFITALVALVVVPYQAQRAAKAIAPKPGERPDTAPLFAAAAVAKTQLGRADSALAAARAQHVAITQALAVDTSGPVVAARRDSMEQRLGELNELLLRVENSPLATSYRALGDARELQGSARVRALLDTLADIEREREALSAAGGVDPTFVALTSRATEIGRAIQHVAQQRRDTLKGQIGRLDPPTLQPSQAAVAAADTIPRLAALDAARLQWERDSTALSLARDSVLRVDARERRARDIAAVSVPPFALLAAALVFGVVLGFGSALIDELRHPRVADSHEAERVAGVRTISAIRPRLPAPERQRREADRKLPPYIDPSADGHQLLYLHVAAKPDQVVMLTITGEEPAISAVVAVNFAAIAADEARNALIVDTDVDDAPVAAALRVRAEPGIVDLIDGRSGWPEATTQAIVGRNRTIDVVPSGMGVPLPTEQEISTVMKRDAARLARHYDAVVVVATEKQALSGLPAALPVPNVVYCARVGHTKHSTLRRAVDGLRASGARVMGIVLWDGEPPPVMTAQELAARPRPQRTAEMEAMGTAR